MLDTNQVLASDVVVTKETVRRARAAVAFRVVRDGWTADETRTVLQALGIERKP